MRYDDFPACLPRYAWLVAEAERAGASRMFHGGDGDCKVCGDDVELGEQRAHVRLHARQLRQSARQREAEARREAKRRLQQLNRLRAETRAAATVGGA